TICMKEGPIPIVIQVRQQSQRCKNKLLRPFYRDDSLTSLAAAKFQGREDVWIAAREPAFREIAEAYKLNFYERNEVSAHGETLVEVANYVEELPGDYIVVYNACCPLLSASTIDEAITAFRASSARTLVPVIETHDVIFDQNKHVINQDATAFNSKFRKPLYIASNAFIIYSKENLRKLGKYFTSYEPEDPLL
ncbi:MAG: hypothetical protein CUN55_17575, partial [Phototrophicales bacterium]